MIVRLLIALLCIAGSGRVLAQAPPEHDPVKRSDLALTRAEEHFDHAKDAYRKNEAQKGDGDLEEMTAALKECIDALGSAHKSRFYKKAELRVALLQRRMNGLVDDISLDQRGWAEQTQRMLAELHDKLLKGAMSK